MRVPLMHRALSVKMGKFPFDQKFLNFKKACDMKHFLGKIPDKANHRLKIAGKIRSPIPSFFSCPTSSSDRFWLFS